MQQELDGVKGLVPHNYVEVVPDDVVAVDHSVDVGAAPESHHNLPVYEVASESHVTSEGHSDELQALQSQVETALKEKAELESKVCIVLYCMCSLYTTWIILIT